METDDAQAGFDLSRRLEALAQGCLPPLDPAPGAVRRARSIRRRRRTGGALAAVAVVGLAGVLAQTVLPTTHPAGRTTVVTTTGGTDPLDLHAAFGWLPASLTDVSYTAQPLRGDADAETAIATTGKKNGPGAILTVEQGNPGTAGMRESGAVNGHPAWVRTTDGGPGGAGVTVVFQSRAGQWLSLLCPNVTQADALAIARGVVSGPIALPVQLTGLTPSEGPGQASLDTVGGRLTDSRLVFAIGGVLVTVDAEPAGTASVYSPAPGSKTATETRNGLRITVALFNTTPGRQTAWAKADPASYFAHIIPLGTDQDGWTTTVIVRG